MSTDETLQPAELASLNGKSYDQLVASFGPPDYVDTRFWQGFGHWQPGDGPPLIRPESPAEAQEIGRCAASRTRFGREHAGLMIHPALCGWCDYPLAELLRACDWAAFRSRYIVTEFAIWRWRNASAVRATGRGGTYEHPAWQAHFESRAAAAESVR